MNPKLVLSLWRERWGKATATTLKIPYARGKVNQWTGDLPHADLWTVAGAPAVTFALCLLLMGFVVSVPLSLNSQIVFFASMVAVALFVRRYAGTLITLALFAMAAIASVRYLYWRFNHTLVQEFSWEFIFGFYFWIAECYLALLISLSLIQSIWPLRCKAVHLPVEEDDWPGVDIFILCNNQPFTAVELTLAAAQHLEWPQKKTQTYLVGNSRENKWEALCSSTGVLYLYPEEQTKESLETSQKYPNELENLIELTLPLSNAEIAVVIEGGKTIDKGFLKSTIGWFLRDKRLGMACTAHHFLSLLLPNDDTQVLGAISTGSSCAVLRVSACTEKSDIDCVVKKPVEHSSLALKLHAKGYGLACIEPTAYNTAELGVKNFDVELASTSEKKYFLTEYSPSGRSIFWKRQFAFLHEILLFYYPIPQLLFFAAPAIYLLGHIQIIATSPQLFAAYAAPHFIHAYILRARTQGSHRFTLLTDIKETVLAWYLLIPVTLTLLRTCLSQCLRPLSASQKKHTKQMSLPPLFEFGVLVPYVLVLSLNLAGFFSGLFNIALFDNHRHDTTTAYLLWATYNLMLLAAMLAVAQEARQVHKYTREHLSMPAMIKLPSGRTVSCVTSNFPELALDLLLPTSSPIKIGSILSVSIFHKYKEFVFTAPVMSQYEQTISLQVPEIAGHDYQSFAAVVFSRGPEWPKWLPSRHVDRPLPEWVTRTLVVSVIWVLDFVTNIGKYFHWARLGSLIKLWGVKKNE